MEDKDGSRRRAGSTNQAGLQQAALHGQRQGFVRDTEIQRGCSAHGLHFDPFVLEFSKS